MTKYIDAEKLKAEIEKRKKENMYVDLPMSIGRYYEDRDLLAFLDTLSEEPDNEDLNDEISRTYHDGSVADTSDLDHVSYENIARHFAKWGAEHLRDTTKMVDESLEEAADDYIGEVVDTAYPGWDWETHDIIEAFIAGAEWQAEKDKETIKLAEDHAYLAGAVNEKEQMLKDAVECELY